MEDGLPQSPQPPKLGFLTSSATEGSQTLKKFPEHLPELTSKGEGGAHSILYQLESLGAQDESNLLS